jgi:hypothetical protein
LARVRSCCHCRLLVDGTHFLSCAALLQRAYPGIIQVRSTTCINTYALSGLFRIFPSRVMSIYPLASHIFMYRYKHILTGELYFHPALLAHIYSVMASYASNGKLCTKSFAAMNECLKGGEFAVSLGDPRNSNLNFQCPKSQSGSRETCNVSL